MVDKQLPEGWQMVKFGDIANNISKRVEPSETDLKIYVGLEHLDPDSLRIKRHGVPSDVDGQKLLVKKGQIIFGKRRAYQRKVAVAEWDCICSAHAMVLEANTDKVLPEFLPFFMQSDVFMNRAVAVSEGSLSPTIKWKTLANQEFTIPSKEKQFEQLEVYSAFQGLQEKADRLADATSSIFENIVTTLMTYGFDRNVELRKTKYLHHNPSWHVYSLSELVLKVKRGPSLSSNERGEGIRYVTSGNLIGGYLDFNVENKYLAGFENIDNCLLKKNDLIINCVNSMAMVGKCALVREDDIKDEAIIGFNNYAMEIDTNKVLPLFLYYFASDRRFTHRIKALVKPAINQVSFASSELRHILVAVPDMKVQEQLVEIIQQCEKLKTTALSKPKENHSLWKCLQNHLSVQA